MVVLAVDFSFDDADFELAALSNDGDADVQRRTFEQKIDLTERKLEIQQTQVREKRRQDRSGYGQTAAGCVDRESQARLDEMKDDARCPCLGCAGDGVRGVSFAGTAMKSAEELGQPMAVNLHAGFEQPAKRRRDQIVEAIARQTGGNAAGVVRRERAVVVRN